MSAKPDLWMPLYFGAYLTDTMHLTTEQHGAYFLLLMACWKRGGELPDDDAQLAATARLSLSQWRKARVVIAPFWQIKNGKWTQKRLTRELELARGYVKAQSENGKKGGRPRKADENPVKNPDETQEKPDLNPDETPLPRPLQTPLSGPGPEPTPPAAPLPTRTAQMVLLLRQLAAAKGKTVRIASIEKKVIAWVEAGVTDEQLTGAFDLALQDREAKGSHDAITPGFIDVFLAKIINPKAAGTRVVAREWHETHAGVIAKCRELGYEPKADDDPRWLKCWIAVKIGGDHWPWIDPKNVTQQGWIDDLRAKAGSAA